MKQLASYYIIKEGRYIRLLSRRGQHELTNSITLATDFKSEEKAYAQAQRLYGMNKARYEIEKKYSYMRLPF